MTDHSQARSEALEKAKAYVERVLAGVSVSVVWAPAPSCSGVNLFLARASQGGSSMGRAAVADGQAWIFTNRVGALAGQKNLDERVLLGRAIVHEIGHLLGLGHSRDGVMRAEIYTEAMEARFAFTPDEIREMRAEIVRRSQACQ